MSSGANRRLDRSRSRSLAPGNIRHLHVAINSIVSRGAGVFLLLVSFVNPFQPVIAYAAGNKNSGELIDIGDGRKMYLECRGSGSPTVILESGYHNDAESWSTPLEPGKSTVFPQVAKFTRVCAYDRPGTFLDANHLIRSTPVLMPRTARDLVSDLHVLLQTAHVAGPYVFAAHSFGGIFARLYASTYPNDVVGMVLVDATSEKVKSALTPEYWKLGVDIGFTKPPPGLEKYRDFETLDPNTSFDQIEKAATAQP